MKILAHRVAALINKPTLLSPVPEPQVAAPVVTVTVVGHVGKSPLNTETEFLRCLGPEH